MVQVPEINPNKQLAISEIADAVGVTARTVQRWATAGEFPNAIRVGNGKRAPYLVPWKDVLSFLERRNNK